MINTINNVFNQKTLSRALEQFGEVSLKYFLLFSIIGVLFVIFLVLVCKLIGKELKLSDILTGIMLAVYCSIILQLTLICRQDNSRIGIELDVFHGLGGDGEFHGLMMAYVVLNGMLFVPYGFLISLFSFVNCRKMPVQPVLVTLISLIASLIIEVTQLLTGRGYYEVQDLVTNTLGGLCGWLIFAIIYNVGRRLLVRDSES